MLKVNAVTFVISEHIKNFRRITSIAADHMKKKTSVTSLGMGWVVFRDLVYFAAFTVFRLLLSGDRLIEGMPLVIYLFTGFVPWFFISDVLNAGSNAINSNKSIISNMKFPITIISSYEVLAILYKRLISFLMLFIVIALFGYLPKFNILLFLYYFTAMVILGFVFNLFLSPIVAISKDFDQFYRSFLRILMFSLPIIWSFERLEDYKWAEMLLKINPIVYVIIGFRDAFAQNDPIDLYYTIYFWSFVIVVFLVGCVLQYKLRKYYDDWM